MNSRLYIDSMNAKKKNEEYMHSITGNLIEEIMYLSNKNTKDFFSNYNRELIESLNERDLSSLFQTGNIKEKDEGKIVIGGDYFGKDYSSRTSITIRKDNSVRVRKEAVGIDPYILVSEINPDVGKGIVVSSKIIREAEKEKSVFAIPLFMYGKNLKNTLINDIESVRKNLNENNDIKRRTYGRINK